MISGGSGHVVCILPVSQSCRNELQGSGSLNRAAVQPHPTCGSPCTLTHVSSVGPPWQVSVDAFGPGSDTGAPASSSSSGSSNSSYSSVNVSITPVPPATTFEDSEVKVTNRLSMCLRTRVPVFSCAGVPVHRCCCA